MRWRWKRREESGSGSQDVSNRSRCSPCTPPPPFRLCQPSLYTVFYLYSHAVSSIPLPGILSRHVLSALSTSHVIRTLPMIQMIVYDIMLSSVWSDGVGNGLRRNRRVSRRTLLSSDSNIGTSHRSPLPPEKGSGKLFPGGH